METVIPQLINNELRKGAEFTIDIHYRQVFKGRGGWNIEADVQADGANKTFRTYTTDSEFIDEISDMKADEAGYEAIEQRYHEKFFHLFVDDIIEWHEEVMEAEEE